MKYQHKCPSCNREASKKYKGVYFCDTCAKNMRKQKATAVFKEVPLFSLNAGIVVYGYSVVKLQ